MTEDKKPITLYTAETPNGWKVSIILEELGIPYNLHHIQMSKNEQKEEWFLKINPNGRIPAIIDHSNEDFAVFESAAILIYLAEKFPGGEKLLPKDFKHRSEVLQWSFFQMGGVGPMQGQANHFTKYAPEKIEYAIKRYQDETRRLYSVLERALEGKEYLVNNQYSVADILNFSWVLIHDYCGVTLDGLPNLKKWVERIAKRPAVVKGITAVSYTHLTLPTIYSV
eukprot:TRINITY_DN219_c0_g2_i2.p1 TRINITY_DN219_c0_g2~~TRINITY_DN219_c0_g2_i2.p1  ORF type:complete len:241 (-),score=73.19 TRINITY_DN219_c0_g2_i2:7-681(-)